MKKCKLISLLEVKVAVTKAFKNWHTLSAAIPFFKYSS